MHALLLALGRVVDSEMSVRDACLYIGRELQWNYALSGTIPSQFGLLTAMTGQLCAHSFLETPPNNGLFGQREAFQDW